MKERTILGIDPSSTTVGLALKNGEDYTYIDIWERNDELSLSENMANFAEFLGGLLPVDVMVVEDLSSPINLDTVKKISFYQGIAMYLSAVYECELVLCKPKAARKIVFGKGYGGKPKEFYYDMLVKAETNDGKPLYDLLPFKKGGGDQSDAIVLVEAYCASS